MLDGLADSHPGTSRVVTQQFIDKIALAGMNDAKRLFAERLRRAMEGAGYEPRPAVLEREYNLRCWGKPLTLHGVRRWLRGEILPGQEKLLVLAEWLRVPPQELRFGANIPQQISARRDELDAAIRYQEREVVEVFIWASARTTKDRQGSNHGFQPRQSG